MSKKTIDLGFAFSLMLSGIIGLTTGISGIADIDVPDALRITLGIISLIDLPFLAFFSVWKIKLLRNTDHKNKG